MKIVQVIFNLSSGGAERFVVDLSNELSIENEVTVFTLKKDSISNCFYKGELDTKVSYCNAGISKGLSLKNLFNIYKIIKGLKADVIHLHLEKTIFYLILPILFYRKSLYVETLHTRADMTDGNLLYYYVKYILYKMKIVELCTISKDNQLSFINHYRTKDSALIYNGRKLPEKTANFENVKDEIKTLIKTPNDLVFVHIARCNVAKNQKMLISAMNKLDIDFSLLIIGDGFESELGIQLKEMACSKIHFLGSKKNVADYLHNADAFCLTSYYEGMPISLIESLACKCIPICTPVSGPSEIIINGVTGFISDEISEESYLVSLQNFLQNKESINKEVLFNYYTNNFSIQKCSNLYLSLYKLLLNKQTVKLNENITDK